MISGVEFRRFKALARVDLTLTPLTALVGPNACGKSSVLQGIERLCALNVARPIEDQRTTSRIGQVFSGEYAVGNVATRGMEGPVRIRAVTNIGRAVAVELVELNGEDPSGRYRIDLEAANGIEASAEFPMNDLVRGRGFWSELGLRALGTAAYFQFDPLVLRAPSHSSLTI